MRVLRSAEMQEADRRAIEDYGIPVLVLMENAALAVVSAIEQRIDELTGLATIVVAGPGNNGGDGLAVARLLWNRGAHVEVILLGGPEQLRSDATRTQFEIVRRLGLPVHAYTDVDQWQAEPPELEECELLVDAIFGTGLSRPADGLPAQAIEAINGAAEVGALVVSVDVPSGLDSDRAQPPGPAVQADLCVSFAALKPCHVLDPAAELCGDVKLADISIPQRALDLPEPGIELALGSEVALRLPVRDPASHKGNYGHALLVAGSLGKSGAALLCGSGALRSGAGLVTVATAASIQPVIASGQPELMTEPLEEQSGALSEAALERIAELAETRQVLALGPGLGTSDATVELVRRVVAEIERPLVLDADALNAFAGELELLAKGPATRVLTPHPGEAARLLGTGTREVQADRMEAARELARRSGSVVLLKGHQSLTATPDGWLWINPTGDPAMATGGTGDVLTGMLAGLLAQGLEPLDATVCAAFLHGLAGELAAQALGQSSVIAGDLLEALPEAFRALRGELDEDEDELA